MKYILDSNVALNWSLPESDSDKAIRLRVDYQNAVRNQGLIPGLGRIEPWSFGKLQAGVTMPNKLEVTLTLDNVWNSKGANWVTTSESYYAAQFADSRFHNMPAQSRPQNIGVTIRKNF